jgi:hypothetical protein
MRLVVLLLGRFLGGLFMISMALSGVGHQWNGVHANCSICGGFVFCFFQRVVSALISRRLFLDEE